MYYQSCLIGHPRKFQTFTLYRLVDSCTIEKVSSYELEFLGDSDTIHGQCTFYDRRALSFMLPPRVVQGSSSDRLHHVHYSFFVCN